MKVIKKDATELRGIQHEGGELVFSYPSVNGHTLEEVTKQIDEEGLLRPTSAHIASLVYEACKTNNGELDRRKAEREDYHKKDILFDDLRDWLWEYTANLFLPKSKGEFPSGVFIVDNPKIYNGRFHLDSQDLITRFESSAKESKGVITSSDKRVRFVPFEFTTGEIKDKKSLATHPYLIGRYGEEGAEKIAAISGQFAGDTYIGIPKFEDDTKELTRCSALQVYGRSFGLFVSNFVKYYEKEAGNYIRGHAFGLIDRIPNVLYGQNLGPTQQKIYRILMQHVPESEQEQVKRKIDSLLK